MTGRYRIAIITSSFPPQSGGIAAAHFNLFHELGRRNEVHAFTFRDADRRPIDGVTHGYASAATKRLFRSIIRRRFRKRPSEPLVHVDRIAETAAIVRNLNRSVARFRPDIILCPDHYVPALMLRKPPGCRLVWMARNNYMRFVDQPLVPPPSTDDLHLAHRLELRGVRKADAVISPSNYMVDVFRKTLRDDLPIRVAKNFVRFDHLASIRPSNLHAQLGLHPSRPIVYVPSGGVPMKGRRHLAEIARGLSILDDPIGLYVSGPIFNDLRWELEQLHPQVRCHLPGAVDYQTNLKNVAACSLTISPTLIENLSNALVESLSLGVPVVTFDTGGNHEIVLAGRTGVVVPYADVTALIRESVTLLNGSERLTVLADRCAAETQQIIDTNSIVDHYQTLFDQLHGHANKSGDGASVPSVAPPDEPIACSPSVVDSPSVGDIGEVKC